MMERENGECKMQNGRVAFAKAQSGLANPRNSLISKTIPDNSTSLASL
jgi:hypothetical protein